VNGDVADEGMNPPEFGPVCGNAVDPADCGNVPWPLVEKGPPDGNAPAELEDENVKFRVGSKGAALLDRVDEVTELVDLDNEGDVDWEKTVLLECANTDAEGDIDEVGVCMTPGGWARPGG